MGLSDYIEALESERSKILVFSKELPLSLDLVTHAIEACRVQLRGPTKSWEQNLNGGHSECSGQTSPEGPVLEEFIPIRKRTPSGFKEDDEDKDEDEQHSHKPKIAKSNNNNDKRKSDWLRSVQLWNNPQSLVNEDISQKTSALEASKRGGGVFQPFNREAISVEKTTTELPANKVCSSRAPTPPIAGSNKKEEREGHNNNNKRKQRRCWSQELHKLFLNALHKLGGADSATPKQIRELMKVGDLTNDEVKSHLQKFRLHTRRTGPMIQNNGDSQTAPFVLVGNFIVQRPPPPEHVGADKVTRTTMQLPGIYAPLASHATTVA